MNVSPEENYSGYLYLVEVYDIYDASSDQNVPIFGNSYDTQFVRYENLAEDCIDLRYDFSRAAILYNLRSNNTNVQRRWGQRLALVFVESIRFGSVRNQVLCSFNGGPSGGTYTLEFRNLAARINEWDPVSRRISIVYETFHQAESPALDEGMRDISVLPQGFVHGLIYPFLYYHVLPNNFRGDRGRRDVDNICSNLENNKLKPKADFCPRKVCNTRLFNLVLALSTSTK